MQKITLAIVMLFSFYVATSQNPRLLKDVYPGATGSSIGQIVKTSNYTFFNAEDDDPDLDRGLYRTDGTAAGTIKLNLTYPTYSSTKAERLTPLGNKVIFAGDNAANYGEIWSSDGTQAGTVALERFQPLNNRVPVVEMKSMGSYTYYSVINKNPVDNLNHAYLRKTDGTAGGTSLVYDFSSFAGVPEVVFLTPVNNILYFIVYDVGGTGVDQLWRSDGTTTGTYMVYNFTIANFVESYIMPAGNSMYIMIGSVSGGIRQNTLWKSDGTAAGTVPVKFIGTGNTNLYPSFASMGNTLYFAGADGNGKELWQTDGTAAGTYMVADINPGAASSNPLSLTVLNSQLFFSANNGTNGGELWKYSAGNAVLVKDINPGIAGSGPGQLTVSGNTIIFNANDGTNGGELWITDGTTSNTVMVADINPGTGNSVPNAFTPGNQVYFAANNGINGSELFTFDNSEGINGLHKIYVNDNSTGGDVFTTAIGNNANPGTKAAPVATVSQALSFAQEGDLILVDAGTYTEQVIISKGISIQGAGKNLSFFVPPATPLVPAPGPFSEIGLFETTQSIGDVHISDLSINSFGNSQNIIIQSGGSVKNCELLNGGQGIFFRIESAVKTAVVENNFINAVYIGVNVQGSGLTASLLNNNISLINNQFSAGVFCGLDFGPLPQFTATGNFISNYVAQGLLANSYNGNITQNHITGSGGKAIERYSGNTLNATCNWYGTNNIELIIPKISGGVNYAPWLSSGTDNSASPGFQPVPGSCDGRQNRFYVNDNSQAGDVLTTAVGNNSNNGFSSAPFATIDHALSVAQAGDIIYVDAGTYITSNLTINKAITLLGANYLISPNDATNALLPNAGRNAETLITNSTFTIGASNINFHGFSFSPGASSQFLQTNTGNDFDNIDISKNIFHVSSGSTVINLTGKQQLPLETSNYSISTNRFIKSVSNLGTNISLAAIDGIQVSGNTFTVDNSTANWTQNDCTGGAFRNNNFTISNNTSYRQRFMFLNLNSNNAQVSFNKAFECVRLIIDINGLNTPSVIDITDNEVTVANSNGVPVISYSKSGGTDLSSPNIARIERNTVSANGTGSAFLPQALIAPTVDNASLNTEVYVRNNVLNISGDFSSQAGPDLYVSGIRFLNNSRKAVVENNDINFTGTNYGTNNKNGIGTVNSGILPDAVYEFRNNKISGFPTSVAIQNDGLPGNLPAGVTININNNSFTGDLISINNGNTGQSANASCNWYGTAAAQSVITKVTPATVNYTPWLSNGTDNDPATGFQPVPGSCNGTQVTAALTQVNNVTCFNAANGSIDVTISGGLMPYTFAWSKDAVAGYSSVEDLSNLSPGVYDLLVTDVNGSTAILSATITQPTLIVPVVTDNSTACSNIATATASGGVAPYSFVWSNNATGPTMSNVPAGTYTVTVTDATNCSVTATITLVTRPAFNPSVQTTDVSCFGGIDGMLTVTNVNGTPPYQYSINGINYQLSNVFNNVVAGIYTVYVIDANNCSGFTTKTINQPAAIAITVDNVQGTCFGSNAGSISISVSGGSPGYSYSWTGPGGFTSTSKNISNLAPGSYSLTVTDSKGCTASLSNVMVSSTNEIIVNAAVVNIACKGETNGSITLNVTGGSGSGFTYAWSNAATTSAINNLLAGNYNVTITDIGSGCSVTRSYSITQPATAVNLSTSKTNATGCASMGTITATGSGGTGAYMYRLNSGAYQSSGSFTNLGGGDYTVWVKDANNCTKTSLVTIGDNGTDEYENNNGKNQAKVIPIASLVNARIAVSTDIDWFKFTTPAGTNTYTVSLTHPNASFVFDLYLTGNNVPALVPVSTTATSKVYVLTGSTLYFIQVSGGTSFTCYNLTVTPQTTFTQPITVTEKDPVEIVNPSITKLAAPVKEVLSLSASAFPNPHLGSFKIQIASPEAGNARVELFSVTGQKLQEKTVNLQKGESNIVQFTVSQHGTVFYRIVVGKNILTGKVIGIE